MRKRLFFSIILCILAKSALALQGTYVSVAARPGVQLPVWLLEPENPTNIVILFTGGQGKVGISQNGLRYKGNFLVRTRGKFAKHGFVVAVVDKPSDRGDLYQFRVTAQHARDIRMLMAFLRKRYPGIPLWLVGTSRGTVSVADVAARIHGKDGPDGIVLTSSVTLGGYQNLDSLRDINLAAITVPTLVLHNKLDECPITPYSGAKDLLGKLPAVKVKAFMGVSGGRTKGNPCMAKSYHGYLGIEDEVVGDISDWITSH